MLVLSRKLGESIEIGNGISVKVIAVQGGRVKIGIEAPESISITRSELLVDQDDQQRPALPELIPGLSTCKVEMSRQMRSVGSRDRSANGFRPSRIPR